MISRAKQVASLDQQIIRLARSTRTSLPAFLPFHNWLRLRLGWYYNWHATAISGIVHTAVFVLALVLFGIFIITLLGWLVIFGLIYLTK